MSYRFNISKDYAKALKAFKNEPCKVKIITVYEDGTMTEEKGEIIDISPAKKDDIPNTPYKVKFTFKYE